ncbi:MAG: hypothetical protein DRQ78_04585 [Epsilonproteobacteria bacterium]|nr:MAG: hypothetical protein DRQ78_04585 [Campylobacterota bacterium]
MDYVGPLINNFRTNSTVFQRFKLKWQSDGTLYNKELVFYENDQVVKDIRMKRFLQSIGMSYDDLENNDYDEVERCWFWFNQNKQAEEESNARMASADIAAVLNDKLTVGDKVRVCLTYGGSTQFYINGHKEEWEINTAGEVESLGMNTDEIFEEIHSDPWMYIANIIEEWEDRNTFQFHRYDSGLVDLKSNETPKGPNSRRSTPVTSTTVRKLNSVYDESSDIKFFALALVDEYNTCFEPTLNNDGERRVFSGKNTSYVRRPEEKGDPVFDVDGNLIIYDKEDIKDFSLIGASSGYTEEYEYTYKGANEHSGLVEMIKLKMKYLYDRDRRENNIMNTLQKQLMNRLHTESVGSVIQATSSKWGEYFSGDQLIKEKVDIMKRYEFVNLLSDCLDTDFKEEEASTFEKIFAVIIIVVAVVITLYSAGAFSPAGMSLAGLAMGLGYASLVLTIGGMMLSQMGLSATSLVKTIGKVAQIVGIAASITGIMASAQMAFEKAAKEAVAKGTIKTTAEYTVSAFAKDAISSAVDSVLDKITSVFDVLSDPSGLLDGGLTGVMDKMGGFMDSLQTGMGAYNRFMGASADSNTPSEPTAEQLSKTNFQYPDQMFELSEQMIYEPDALQKMSIMKDNQFGGARTEKLLDQIA